MKKRIKFFSVNLDLYSMQETLGEISYYIKNRTPIQHVVVNVSKLVYAQKDEQLRNIINACPIINVDGAGVILGAKMLGINIPHRVTGIDLMEELIKYSSENGYRVYFFGATEEVNRAVVEHYVEKYPNLQIAGRRNGYYTEQDEKGIVEEMKNSNADILFVAMGSPKKEIFLGKYSKDLNIPFTMGVGGSFDVVTGKVKRAPIWVQNMNSEWLYRLIQEPRRMWKRYFVTNSLFLLMIIKEKIHPTFTKNKIEDEN